mgnify:FL=1
MLPIFIIKQKKTGIKTASNKHLFLYLLKKSDYYDNIKYSKGKESNKTSDTDYSSIYKWFGADIKLNKTEETTRWSILYALWKQLFGIDRNFSRQAHNKCNLRNKNFLKAKFEGQIDNNV